MAETAAEFFDKHGYTKGTYEGQLTSQGWNLADVKAKVGSWGNNMNPGEYAKITGQLGSSPIKQQGDAAKEKLQGIASQEYNFDPQKYLPGIQSQADAIYDPQQAQLEAIRLLQQQSYKETSGQTEKQFNDTLKSEIESINNRGAYFAGGAIEREQDINDQKLSALNQLGLQATAADFSNLAQQGLLAAEESQFITDRLYNAESGAYARWSDQRNFSYQAALQEYAMYTDERDFARGVFESDRTYDMSVQENAENQRRFELQYDMTKDEFERAKEEWNYNMNQRKMSDAQAMEAFKSKYDNSNPVAGWKDFADSWSEPSTPSVGAYSNISPDNSQYKVGGVVYDNKSYTPPAQNDGGIYSFNW